jgi:hypothetical protein
MAPESNMAWHPVSARQCNENVGWRAHSHIFVIRFLFQGVLRKTRTAGLEPTTTKLRALRSADLYRRVNAGSTMFVACWFHVAMLHARRPSARPPPKPINHDANPGHTPPYTLGAGYVAEAKTMFPHRLRRTSQLLAIHFEPLNYGTVDDCRG